MTKATAIHIAVLLLCSSAAATAATDDAPQAAQTAPSADTTTDEIQKVVIVSTGSRGSQRTVIDTPVPIDILSSRELTKTSQNSLDKALGFRVPSFNTVQTPVNDATSLLDPYEIRNMGPSRVLILINGKRKNSSALVYTQTSPGRGESGADISAIPSDAIKRIEVLRDGASAQYGSDAIAGVVNIILKDSPNEGSFTARIGQTGERDGKSGSVSLNDGVSIGGKGFLNYTIEASKVGLANRPGVVSARGEAATFGADLATQVQPFLNQYPDAGNINGSPETKAAKFLVNAGYDIDDTTRAYANFAYIKKDIFSFANYRTPYWQPTDYGLLTPSGQPYKGYGPHFNGTLQDFNATGGVKSEIAGWNSDVSLTFGGNKQRYQVENTVNHSLGATSPTVFHPGGVEFSHTVFNADFSKQVLPKVNTYFGTELRGEEYETNAGDLASYIDGGADSYAGNDPANSFKKTRRNYGVYLGGLFDVTDSLLLDAIGRYEKYSDFGNAFVWKLSSRFKVTDTFTVRGSVSTGFRAPSLHQIYTQKAQYSFVDGKIQRSGLFNNISPEAQAVGVNPLDAEKSRNITLGLGYKPTANTSMTIDYYNIHMKNRIILGKEIRGTGDPANPLDIELAKAKIVSMSFFTNALDSDTSGLDYVFSHKNMPFAGGRATFNLSGNYTLKNERDGAVQNTAFVAGAGQSVLDATQEALIFTSRPKHKTIIGLDLDYNKFNFSLNNTVFGPTTFRQADLDSNLKTEFKTKTVTDFGVNYQMTDKITLSFNINNLFDVTPKWEMKALNPTGQALLDSTTLDASGRTPSQVQSDAITFNQRYAITTYDGSQFSQLGRIFNAALNIRF
ncbi:TonB-dependent siderophore receptor [Massilia sp. CF038]|uniref:TonB-dependent receptor plug domain-containing protein n=1 Tax=Massilia sp. CF038 TaxID=1881045 RepID=UPI00091DD27F|nr:TonB-dependent receptor [Massilia sp. CF038]SHH54789.1 iron complex outermembrane recepter protein [Massilia sp. CF038]